MKPAQKGEAPIFKLENGTLSYDISSLGALSTELYIHIKKNNEKNILPFWKTHMDGVQELVYPVQKLKTLENRAAYLGGLTFAKIVKEICEELEKIEGAGADTVQRIYIRPDTIFLNSSNQVYFISLPTEEVVTEDWLQDLFDAVLDCEKKSAAIRGKGSSIISEIIEERKKERDQRADVSVLLAPSVGLTTGTLSAEDANVIEADTEPSEIIEDGDGLEYAADVEEQEDVLAEDFQELEEETEIEQEEASWEEEEQEIGSRLDENEPAEEIEDTEEETQKADSLESEADQESELVEEQEILDREAKAAALRERWKKEREEQRAAKEKKESGLHIDAPAIPGVPLPPVPGAANLLHEVEELVVDTALKNEIPAWNFSSRSAQGVQTVVDKELDEEDATEDAEDIVDETYLEKYDLDVDIEEPEEPKLDLWDLADVEEEQELEKEEIKKPSFVPSLRLVAKDEDGETILDALVDKPNVVLGKSAKVADIVIPVGKGVSRRHCKIVRLDDVDYIVDLASKNGTYINSEMIEPELALEVKPGDALRLADIVLDVLDGGEQ